MIAGKRCRFQSIYLYFFVLDNSEKSKTNKKFISKTVRKERYIKHVKNSN